MAWKRFLNDLSKAMIMTDPIAYGWYVAWTLESDRRNEPVMARRRAPRLKPDILRLARRVG